MSPSLKWSLAAVLMVFAITRGAMLAQPTEHRSVVDEMGQVGLTYRLAQERGEPFYDLYAKMVRSRQDAVRGNGGPPQDQTRDVIEYPPLAVAMMVAPAYFCDLHGPDPLGQYARTYHAMLWGIDVATFLTLAWVLCRLYPGIEAPARLLVYVVGGVILRHLIYDRFDLVVGMLVVLAMALLITRVHWTIPLLVLAVAVNLKLVPIILMPVFLMRSGSMTSAILRSVVFAAMCLAIFAPFYLDGGNATLAFLKYHAERGLHVESIPATTLLFSIGNSLSLRYGAIEITTSAAHVVGIVASVAAILTIMLNTILTAWRAKRGPLESADVILLSMLMLWSAMTTSKVFSPQYLLWLLPLVPLIPLRKWKCVSFSSAFLMICCLTTIIFPYRYWTDIVRPFVDPPRYELLGPTALGLSLLLLRNGLFVLLLVALASAAWKRIASTDS